MREFIEDIIASGNYKLEELEGKIKRLYAMGDLTEEDMTELLAMAAAHVVDSKQVDLFAKVVDLEHRIEALETADYVVWKQGYVTRKGEIVKIDLDGDDVLDYAMYDGGRPETSLPVGKIDGWYKVTSAGVKTHAITRNADKTFLLTPIGAAT